jgi:hypothetical protein
MQTQRTSCRWRTDEGGNRRRLFRPHLCECGNYAALATVMADTFTLGRNQLKRLLSSDFEEVSSEEVRFLKVQVFVFLPFSHMMQDNKPCYNAVPPPVSLPGGMFTRFIPQS